MLSFYDFYVANSAVRAPCAAIAKFTNHDTDNSESKNAPFPGRVAMQQTSGYDA
jgi:hypothetical protein